MADHISNDTHASKDLASEPPNDPLEVGMGIAFASTSYRPTQGGMSVLESIGKLMNGTPQVMLADAEEDVTREPCVLPNMARSLEVDPKCRYRLDGEIARGGMGAILKGRDNDLGRDLAVKVLLDSHKDKPAVVQRFVEEAQIGGQLQHPGIAPVYELGQFEDKRPFFTMKLVKGKTLAALLESRQSPADDRSRFLGIFEQVCQTVAYAHSRGVIHRDLKPANIMVGAFGEVQVMDWGLAKVLATGGIADEARSAKTQNFSVIETIRSSGEDTPMGAGSLTQLGSVMGTPAYMPPEQALGEVDQLDERSDVFGLGAILCEILTGKPPYVAEDSTRVFRLASRAKLDPCYERIASSGADQELMALAIDCLSPEPTDRPREAGVLTTRVTAYLESVQQRLKQAEIDRAQEAARAEEERKRRRASLFFSAAICLLVSAIAGGGYWLQRQIATAAEERTEAAERLAKKEKENVLRESATKHRLANALYHSGITLAHSQCNDGQLGDALATLNKLTNNISLKDQIGFEWHLLRRRCGVPEFQKEKVEVADSLRQFWSDDFRPPWRRSNVDRQLTENGSRICDCQMNEDDGSLELYVWDWETGKELLRQKVPNQPVTRELHPRLSPDGTRAATVSHNDSGTSLFVWDVDRGQLEQKMLVSNEQLRAGRINFSFAGNDAIAFTDTARGEPPFLLRGSPGPVTLSVWDIESGERRFEQRMLDSAWRSGPTTSADGSRVAVLTSSETLPPGLRQTRGAGFDVETRFLHIQVIDAMSGEELNRFAGDPGFRFGNLCFSPDGLRLAFATSGYHSDLRSLSIWDLQNGKRVLARPIQNGTECRFSPDGQLIAIGNENIEVFDSSTGLSVSRFYNPLGCFARFSDDGSEMVLHQASQRGGTFRWNVQPSQNLIPEITNVSSFELGELSGDRSRVARISRDQQALLVRDKSGAVIMQIKGAKLSDPTFLPGKRTPIPQLALSFNGSRLITYSPGDIMDVPAGAIAVWNVNSGATLATLAHLSQGEFIEALECKGDRVAAIINHGADGDQRYTLKTWNLKTNESREISSEAAIGAIAFSSDGKQLFASLGAVAATAVTVPAQTRATGMQPAKNGPSFLAIYQADSLAELDRIPTDSLLGIIVPSHDDQLIVGVQSGRKAFLLLERTSRKPILQKNTDSWIFAPPIFSQDNKRLMLFLSAGECTIWNVSSGELLLSERMQLMPGGAIDLGGDRIAIRDMPSTFLFDGSAVDPQQVMPSNAF